MEVRGAGCDQDPQQGAVPGTDVGSWLWGGGCYGLPFLGLGCWSAALGMVGSGILSGLLIRVY